MCTCNETNCVEIAGVIVAAVIPVVIMIITLCSQKKKHLEQLAQINEKNRIDAMPIIDFHSSQISGVEEENQTIVSVEAFISVVNSGNGTAVNVSSRNSTNETKENISRGAFGELKEQKIAIKDGVDGCIDLLFNDLYGNIYKETINVSVEKNGATYDIKRTTITIPEIVSPEK